MGQATRQVGSYDGAIILRGIDATFSPGEPGELLLVGDEADLANTVTEVRDGWLVASVNQDTSTLTVRLAGHAKQLRHIESRDGSRVTAIGPHFTEVMVVARGGSEIHVSQISSDSVAAESEGGSRITTEGRADHETVRLTGGAVIEGQKLVAAQVEVDITGGSQGDVTATESVSGRLLGGAFLRVYGRPRSRTVSASGGSHIEFE